MSAEERCFGHESVKRKPRTDLGIANHVTGTALQNSHSAQTMCELRKKRICALHTLPLVDLIYAAPPHQMLLFKRPTPHFSGLNLVIFLHSTYDLKYQVHLLIDLF